MGNFHLDDYDKKIIQLLQEDSSISNIELSKKIGLAPSSCLLRVKNLKEQKVLKQFTAVVDEKILGFEITCFAKVAMQPLNRETSTMFVEEVCFGYVSLHKGRQPLEKDRQRTVWHSFQFVGSTRI